MTRFAKPCSLMVRSENIPAVLKRVPQWVTWRYGFQQGQWKKVPYKPSDGSRANVRDPLTWENFTEVHTAYEQGGYDGLGFVLTPEDPYVALDLDGCRELATGEVSPQAQEILKAMDSYTECSPSGTGVHVVCESTLPPTGRKRQNIEIYDQARFFAVTGHHVHGYPEEIRVRNEVVQKLHRKTFGAEESQYIEEAVVSSDLSDEEVLNCTKQSKHGRKFASLGDGDWRGFRSQSEADLAYISILTRWTRDREQVDRIFRRSGLMRSKWMRKDYRDSTIECALKRRSSGAPPAVLGALRDIEEAMWCESWPGKAGQSQWKILLAVIAHGKEHGELIPYGVRINVSHRQLAERSGCTRPTVTKHLRAMRYRGTLRFDNYGRGYDEPGTIVLLFASGSPINENPAEPADSNPDQLSAKPDKRVETLWIDGTRLSQLRWSAPGLKRLGPGVGRTIQALLRAGGEEDKRILAETLNMRTSNLTRKGGVLERMVASGIVERRGDRILLVTAWQEKLQEAVKAGLEEEAAQTQAAYHKLERARRAHKRDESEISQKRLANAKDEHETVSDRYQQAKHNDAGVRYASGDN